MGVVCFGVLSEKISISVVISISGIVIVMLALLFHKIGHEQQSG